MLLNGFHLCWFCESVVCCCKWTTPRVRKTTNQFWWRLVCAFWALLYFFSFFGLTTSYIQRLYQKRSLHIKRPAISLAYGGFTHTHTALRWCIVWCICFTLFFPFQSFSCVYWFIVFKSFIIISRSWNLWCSLLFMYGVHTHACIILYVSTTFGFYRRPLGSSSCRCFVVPRSHCSFSCVFSMFVIWFFIRLHHWPELYYLHHSKHNATGTHIWYRLCEWNGAKEEWNLRISGSFFWSRTKTVNCFIWFHTIEMNCLIWVEWK